MIHTEKPLIEHDPSGSSSYDECDHVEYENHMLDDKIKTILDDCLSEQLAKSEFNEELVERTKQLTSLLRVHLKRDVPKLTTIKYKYVIHVHIGAKCESSPYDAFKTATQCVFDHNTDKYIFHTYNNEHIYCLAQVFCLKYV
jgi:hypothetical protein